MLLILLPRSFVTLKLRRAQTKVHLCYSLKKSDIQTNMDINTISRL